MTSLFLKPVPNLMAIYSTTNSKIYNTAQHLVMANPKATMYVAKLIQNSPYLGSTP